MELSYHKSPEFAQLIDAQRDELLEIGPPKKGRGKKESRHKKGDRGGRHNSHGRKKPWEKKIKGQVAADIKKTDRGIQRGAKEGNQVSGRTY